jgi:chemotaxis signal transduction protein
MTTVMRGLGERVTDLRRAFDESFGASPESAPEETIDILAIRISGDAYGFDTRGLASLAPSPRVVPVPSRRLGLVGLVGIRGTLVPAYSLGVLLGYEPSRSPARWLALAGSPDPIAFGFDELEGFLRVNASDVRPLTSRRHISATAHTEKITRMVVDTHGLVAALKAVAGSSSMTKEQ